MARYSFHFLEIHSVEIKALMSLRGSIESVHQLKIGGKAFVMKVPVVLEVSISHT